MLKYKIKIKIKIYDFQSVHKVISDDGGNQKLIFMPLW